ncbi:MAG: aspartate-semialdehyde dehydrogenase [Bacteroidetes bacterium]|nr:aspartate-semialdehyde dehydrogenase [Bacteroidota bacterium]
MKLHVGILGATGAVGQKFIRLLQDHPWFEISFLAASNRSAGRPYGEAANWIESIPLPAKIASMIVQDCTPVADLDLVFSGLDASVAGDVEMAFAQAGIPVVSNAKNHRMDPSVPLLIPEVNPNHLALIERQKFSEGGFIVTNPNCASVGLTLALKPIHDAFGVEAVSVTTLQALSGAGYPGVASLDALANVIPFIGGEEDKLATEPLKILAPLETGSTPEVSTLQFPISAQCTRVPVLEGHLECVSVKLSSPADSEAVRKVLESFEAPAEIRRLPSSPERCLQVLDEPDAPQTRRHVGAGDGMTVSIGRVRPCEVLDVKFVVLSHNTVRGAAGGAILNAELLAAKGLLHHRAATLAAQGS